MLLLLGCRVHHGLKLGRCEHLFDVQRFQTFVMGDDGDLEELWVVILAPTAKAARVCVSIVSLDVDRG